MSKRKTWPRRRRIKWIKSSSSSSSWCRLLHDQFSSDADWGRFIQLLFAAVELVVNGVSVGLPSVCFAAL